MGKGMSLWNCNLQWVHCPFTGRHVDEYGDSDEMINERRRLKYSQKKKPPFSFNLSGQCY
jgi:hypothetical protein